METPRLATHVFVGAGLRRCAAEGVAAVVVRRGHADAGDVVIKHYLLGQGFRVWVRVRTGAGKVAFRCVTGDTPGEEAEADEKIARRIAADPDLWVVEIESRDGWLPWDLDRL